MAAGEKPEKKTLSTTEFLQRLKGKKLRIIPNIQVELEGGQTISVEADCSGCNNANIVLDATFEQRQVGEPIDPRSYGNSDLSGRTK